MLLRDVLLGGVRGQGRRPSSPRPAPSFWLGMGVWSQLCHRSEGRQLSSTPLEILLFLNGWYYATYFLLEIFIFVYKGLLLPYPSANLALDLVMLFLYLGIEVTRIFFGSKGNLCQRKVPLSISLALTFPAAVMAAYYLLLQTYALRLEAILNAILLLFYAVELLLGILTLASFSSVDSY
ncbi:transmembrane protein 216 isoform X1 [Alligator sinensis]|uniref:Transmembrane protein 216 n=3 Tax=Archelosauria TaxID=1329799 RepID=A0A3Q0GX02_ALLSI|nr:transmembrane protein 216 isoform X1 [Alligator sinensis]XP_025062708.1 transmembrane protein 216 isoform X1 [Alligator sinensis]